MIRATRNRRANMAALALLPLLMTACGNDGTGSTGAGEVSDLAAEFDGKKIEFVVPYSPGGGYDTTARLIAPYLEEALPGNPNIVVTNVQGGGGLKGVIYALNQEAGMTVGLMSVSRWYTPQLVGAQIEGLDVQDIDLMGTPNSATNHFACVRNDRAASWDDLRAEGRTLQFGGLSSLGGLERQVRFLKMAGFPVEVVRGYGGGAEIIASLARGETDATVRCAPQFGITEYPELIADPGLSPLWYDGEPPSQEFLDELGMDVDRAEVPELTELPGLEVSDELMNAYRAAASFATFSRTMFIHSDTPDKIAEAWHTAYEQAATNEEFRAELAKAGEVGNNVPAEEIQEAEDLVKSLSPEGIELFRDFIGVSAK